MSWADKTFQIWPHWPRGERRGDSDYIVTCDMYPAPVLTRPAPTHRPGPRDSSYLSIDISTFVYPVPAPDALSNLKTASCSPASSLIWCDTCSSLTTSGPRGHVTVAGHVCVGGLSDSARGGWINAEQIINSESGADIMHPRPLPPRYSGAGLS